MAITFSSACKPTAPVIYDPTVSQATGAVSTGIGLGVGTADGGTQATTRIGGLAVTLKFDTDGNAATPP